MEEIEKRIPVEEIEETPVGELPTLDELLELLKEQDELLGELEKDPSISWGQMWKRQLYFQREHGIVAGHYGIENYADVMADSILAHRQALQEIGIKEYVDQEETEEQGGVGGEDELGLMAHVYDFKAAKDEDFERMYHVKIEYSGIYRIFNMDRDLYFRLYEILHKKWEEIQSSKTASA